MLTRLFIAALLAAAPLTASAQDALREDAPETTAIYGWVDGRGAWHFVDSIEAVPAAYRAQARANAMPTGTAKVAETDEREVPTARAGTPATSRVQVRPAPVPAPEPRSEADDEPTRAGLEQRRNTLLADLAALEEGNVPGPWLDEAGEDGLSEAEVERRYEKLLTELEQLDRQLGVD